MGVGNVSEGTIVETSSAVVSRRGKYVFPVGFGLLYAAVFGLYLYISYHQAFNLGPSTDLAEHIAFANAFYAGHYPASYPGLYILWFVVSRALMITTAHAALIVDALLAVAIAVIIKKVLERSHCSEAEQLIYTAVLMVVTPVYVPFFSRTLYLGQISPNIYHNPTILAVKPFAYLSVLLYVTWYRANGSSNRLFALVALAILLSLAMKPNFLLAIAPAIVVYLLLKRPGFGVWWKTAVLFLLAGVALIIQYAITYNQPGDTSQIQLTKPFLVWRMLSPNPVISIFISLLFPLCILVFRWREVTRNDFLVLSWLGLCVGIAEFTVLGESGIRIGHGNLGWGMQAMIPLVFLFSIVEWVRWLRAESSRRVRWRVMLTGVLLSLHVVSGVLYIAFLLSGRTTFA